MSGISLFSVVREALEEGAGAGKAEYVYPRAWDLLDRLDTALHMLRFGMDELWPDSSLTTESEFWARHGQRTVLDTIEEAIRSRAAAGADTP